MSGVAGRRRRPRAAAARPPCGVLLGRARRALLLLDARRSRLAAARSRRGWGEPRGAGVLVGFGAASRSRRCSSSLLESLGRGRWALLAVACAARPRRDRASPAPVPRRGLVVGGGGRRARRARRPWSPCSPARRARWRRRCGSHEGRPRQRGLIIASADGRRVVLARRAATPRRRSAGRVLPQQPDPRLSAAAPRSTTLVAGAGAPRLLVVNPASGPGAEPQPGLRRAVARAQARRRAGARLRRDGYGARAGRRRRGRHRPLPRVVRRRRHLPRRGRARRDRIALLPALAATSAPRRAPARRPQPGRGAGARLLRRSPTSS